jgi:hypothetical protein
MPMNNSKQAYIQLNGAQMYTLEVLIDDLVKGHDERPVVGLTIEETNLTGTVAVHTAEPKNRTFLIGPNGQIHDMGESK